MRLLLPPLIAASRHRRAILNGNVMVTRKIKEELLAATEPDFYPEYKRKRAVKREFKADPDDDVVFIKRESGLVDVKPKREFKRAVKRPKKKDEYYGDDGDVKYEGRVMSKRRPYNWKGRKVKLVLRPGVPVIFTPGQRSGVRAKRSNDEVYADEDILEQSEKRSGEFAYGKRFAMSYDVKPEYVPLETGNPTPSLKPVTEQKVVKVARKRGRGEFDEMQPTVQMLESKRKRPNAPEIGIKEVQDVTMRPIKQVTRNVAVATVDVEMPQAAARQMIEAMEAQPSSSGSSVGPVQTITPMETQSASTTVRTLKAPQRKHRNRYPLGKNYGKANSILPQVLYHPSIRQGASAVIATAKAARTSGRRRRAPSARSRRRTRAVGSSRVERARAGVAYYPSSSGRRTTRRGVRLPMVRYHPSISRTVRAVGTVPTVRYHPSISL